MEVTRVEIKLNREEHSKVKAFCTVTFDGTFIIKNIVIIKDEDGCHFINYPYKLVKNGDALSVAHPLTKEYGKYVEDKVLDEYEKVLNEGARTNAELCHT
jgi:stage V sporulation protein G